MHLTFFYGALKTIQKGEEKDAFDIAVEGPVDGAIGSALDFAPKDSLNSLLISENIVNALKLQLLLIMLNLPTMQAISRGAVCWGRGVEGSKQQFSVSSWPE